MPNGMEGWGRLGAALAGGGQTDAYNRGRESAARIETLLSQARIKRDEAMAREELADSLEAMGAPRDLATVLRMGDNFAQATQGYRNLNENNIQQEALGAARGGNIGQVNDLLTVLSGKPRERTDIRDGMAYDPYADPGQAMHVTASGAADISAAQALAGERSAHAALYGRTDPNLRGSGSAAKPAAYSAPSATSLAAVLGGAEGAVDPDSMQDFQVWRAANPQYRNGEEALTAYFAAKRSSPDVHFIDPSMPGSMTVAPPARLSSVISRMPDDQTAVLEQEIGRPLTQEELRDLRDGELNIQLPPEQKAKPTQAFAQKALNDAREAVRRGVISKEDAKARLIQAGLKNTAERL